MSEPVKRPSSRRHVIDQLRSYPLWIQRALPVLGLVVVMWVLEIIDLFLGGRLNQFGIQPLDPAGLPGILFAPLLHSGFGHLLSNTLPFLVMGAMIAWLTRKWWLITAGIWLVGGVGTWLIGGMGTNHIGASVIVYGYAAFLVTYGILSRRFTAIAAAVVVVLLYGGIVWGFLPINPRVSWQGHLAGAAAGVVVAFADTRQARRDLRERRNDALVP
ncbi:rhomboid family intramembrane serine protease [Citricoccus sp. K5]|uniref:rhomboid family intramembrane serine protease n=1 Tax=Citricoccus sp. K5 TaxID=2653135 RepID=UPI0012F367C9|nr:rhomboid family intramembrane serine protease [Citricoccus sp. K5]VXB03521.1 Rhomboid family protein [Citricoccus sp. K5]